MKDNCILSTKGLKKYKNSGGAPGTSAVPLRSAIFPVSPRTLRGESDTPPQ
jgi:hypothetical protein